MFLVWPPFKLPTLQPYLDIRERYERRVNKDFNSGVNDNRTDMYSRWRAGANLRLTTNLSATAEYQLSIDAGWTKAKIIKQRNSDLSLGYFTYKPNKDLTINAGRQRFGIGDQRLIGPGDWVNVPKSFDALRFTGKNWEAWAMKIAIVSPTPIHARVAGASYNWSGGLCTFIFRHDILSSGDIDDYTLDDVYRRQFGRWDLDAEAVGQVGQLADKNLSTFATRVAVGYKFEKSLRGFAGFSYGSGGTHGHTVHTFQSLYPSTHDQFGAIDMQCWKNVEELFAGLEYTRCPTVTSKLAWHGFRLANTSDAWYNANGSPNTFAGGKSFIDPTGNSGGDVGQEFDFINTWSPNSHFTFSGGAGTFLPGNFVQRVSGHRDQQFWCYLQGQMKF